MKTLFSAIGLFALVNILGLGGFLGWLHMTDRLDSQRVQQVRRMFSETIAEQQAREKKEEDEARALEEDANLEARIATPPVSASEMLGARLEASEIDRQVIERLRREVDDLKAILSRERRELDDEIARFEAEKTKFTAMRERLDNIEGEAQFMKSLSVLQGLEAKEAKQTLQELIDMGENEQVVSYLNRMEERKRTGVMQQFVKDEPALAARLLEDLRLRGLEVAEAAGQ